MLSKIKNQYIPPEWPFNKFQKLQVFSNPKFKGIKFYHIYPSNHKISSFPSLDLFELGIIVLTIFSSMIFIL